MKTFLLIGLLLTTPLAFYGQKGLTGLWTGTLSNDSSTIRKSQSFELALTEYRGKLYGYCRSSFIVNDTLYYTVKRVKGKVEGPDAEIKDDEIITSNFAGRVNKGIKVTMTFRMNKQDSTWHLDGKWKTIKTKNFYSISGGVTLRSEQSFNNSILLPHLEELGKAKELDFYNEYLSNKILPKSQPVRDTITTEPAPVIITPTALVKVLTPAERINSRPNNPPQLITFLADSLELALYDNGEVDGDTVSVLLNGELLIDKQVLKTTPIRKKIVVPADGKDMVLILFAENLGRYPPNTGLLVIYDGAERYQLRFSADLQQNASIILRRKK